MKALIVGVSGFAGTHLAHHLLEQGDQVKGCSRSPTPLKSIDWRSWDLGTDLDRETSDWIRSWAPDCIFHLAAESIPNRCGKAHPNEHAWTTNVEGTRRVVELANQLERPVTLLFTSSCHVYGPMREDQAICSETRSPAPRTGYSISKLSAEKTVWETRREQVRPILVRAFHHAGVGQQPQLMIPEWVAQLLQPELDPICVQSLSTYLDLTDVRDTVRAYRMLAMHAEAQGIYNVGRAQAVRSGDLLDELFQICGRRPQVHQRYEGPRFEPIADNRRLVELTGWQPEIALSRTLRDIYDFCAKG